MKILSVFVAAILFPASVTVASGAEESKYAVGFRRVIIKDGAGNNHGVNGDLILSLWYPTLDTGRSFVPLSEFTYNYLDLNNDVVDSVRSVNLNGLKASLTRWYGKIEDEKWSNFLSLKSRSLRDAAFHPRRFPLVLGRLRAFSTTMTNEAIAASGFIVCMVTPVQNYPPAEEDLYLQQVDDEILYFKKIRNYLNSKLQISTGRCALMGFSGNGISPFLAGVQPTFDAVVLIESGIFLYDIFPIIVKSTHYTATSFKTPLLFLYNKQEFEKGKMNPLYESVRSDQKHLILFDNPAHHHWHFATEGSVSTKYLGQQSPDVGSRQTKSFQLMNQRVIRFLDHYLKHSSTSISKYEVVGE